MRKIYFIIFSLLLVAWPLAGLAEKIDDFLVEIKINKDSSIEVSERIDYDFGQLERHGIYRDIPVSYQARGGNYNLRLKVNSVVDEAGNEYGYSLSREGDNQRIKIGDADKYVSGTKTYIISYRVLRALNFFSDHDELYWNTTGNDWPVPIIAAETKVDFYRAVDEGQVDYTCYQGLSGSSQNCAAAGFAESGGGVAFHSYNLSAGEGQTIVVGWPKGIVDEPSWWQNLVYIIKDNWILVLPLLVLALMIYLWRRYGRDPKGRQTIIPEYDAPKDLSPLEAGTIIDERVDNKEISAEIIYLAVKGYLKIKRLPGKGIFKKDDYELTKLKTREELDKEHHRLLLEGLFGSKDAIKLSELKEKFYEDLKKIRLALDKYLTQAGYFPKSPYKTKMAYFVAGAVLLAVGVLASGIAGGALSLISFIISGIIVISFSFIMPVKTRKGVLARESILGLKMYLGVAEKDRLKFHNAPKRDPEGFEKLLPYAMVLGVEKEWAEQFASIYQSTPSWYSDAGGHSFSALYLAGALGDFRAQASTTLASRPSSAAGGGSGFSGGGAGGGFGGGGGGSW